MPLTENTTKEELDKRIAELEEEISASDVNKELNIVKLAFLEFERVRQEMEINNV